jgi:hypothetical protein
MAAEFERLAYEAALRSLDKQEGLVGELRTRTNTLLAASSLAASFLGREALRRSGSSALTVAALFAFVVSVAASIFVLLPKKKLIFAGAGARTYEALYEGRDDMPTIYRRLAYELDCLWISNNSQIAGLSRAYTTAALASMLELLVLAALTWGNILSS